jgi:hypothetical protein
MPELVRKTLKGPASESDNMQNSVVKCCPRVDIDLSSRSLYGCAFALLCAFGRTCIRV